MRIVVCFLLIVLTSCTGKTGHDVYKSCHSELTFEMFEVSELLGNPYQMEIIDDFLIVADNVDGQGLLIHNLADSMSVRRLPFGQGPGDIIPPLALDVDVNKRLLYVLSRETGECKIFQPNKLFDGNNFHQTIDLGMADRFAKVSDGYACSGLYEDGIFLNFNEDGCSTMVIDSFPDCSITDISLKYKMLQGRLSGSHDGKHLIYAPSYASYIKFYTQTENEWVCIDSLCIGNRNIEKRMAGNGNCNLYRTDYQYCLDICKSDKYFFVLIDGNKLNEDGLKKSHYIMKFSFHGQLEHVYKVHYSVRDICVTDNRMFALMNNEQDGESIIGFVDLK